MFVRRGEPVGDGRLDGLAARWSEHEPCVFYSNVYENLDDGRSTWAGLAIHEGDAVDWDPAEGAEGLVRRFEARRAVHGFGWRGPSDDVVHDLLPLMRKAPSALWGRPKTFISETLLACNLDDGQHLFWSCWLLY